MNRCCLNTVTLNEAKRNEGTIKIDASLRAQQDKFSECCHPDSDLSE